MFSLLISCFGFVFVSHKMQFQAKPVVYCINFGFFADVNECESNPCLNNGTCLDRVNGFNCSCPLGFSGDRCEEGKESYLYLINLMQTYIQYNNIKYYRLSHDVVTCDVDRNTVYCSVPDHFSLTLERTIVVNGEMGRGGLNLFRVFGMF